MAINQVLSYNGQEISHTDHTFRIDGLLSSQVKSFNSDASFNFGKAPGTNAISSATTSGVPEYTASLEIYTSLYNQLIKKWGNKWAKKSYQIVVTISLPGEPTKTDVYYVAKTTKRAKNTSEGSDPQVVSLDLMITNFTEDNIQPF